MVNVLERRFTYVVDVVEEEHTTWQRNGVRPAVTEKLQLLRHIRGEPRIFIGKEYAECLFVVKMDNAYYRRWFSRGDLCF